MSPTTEISNDSVTSSQPVQGFVYIPFSQAPPSDYKQFFDDISEEKDLMISRNVKLRRSRAQVRVSRKEMILVHI
jgi:hypothetical protein